MSSKTTYTITREFAIAAINKIIAEKKFTDAELEHILDIVMDDELRNFSIDSFPDEDGFNLTDLNDLNPYSEGK